MAKFALMLTTIAVLFLVTSASLHATIEIEEENPRGRRAGGDCQEQFQRQQQLNHCQTYMREECGGRQGRGGRRDIDLNQGRQLQQCCRQLEEMETRCRCQGLEQAVMQQRHQEEGRRMEREEMYDCARNIPSMCRMEPSECQMGRRFEF